MIVQTQARSFVDSFIWGFLIVFFVPTTLVVASWKAIPGDVFFPVKIAVENVALAIVSPSARTSGSLKILYTERRLGEAQTLMAMKQSVTGLAYFETQMQETKQSILETSDPVVRDQLAKEYVQSLSNMSVDLAKEKSQIDTQTRPSQPSGSTQTYSTNPQDPLIAVQTGSGDQPSAPAVTPSAQGNTSGSTSVSQTIPVLPPAAPFVNQGLNNAQPAGNTQPQQVPQQVPKINNTAPVPPAVAVPNVPLPPQVPVSQTGHIVVPQLPPADIARQITQTQRSVDAVIAEMNKVGPKIDKKEKLLPDETKDDVKKIIDKIKQKKDDTSP